MTHDQWKASWAGRLYRCSKTGVEFRIPDDVRECDCFFFGESFIDVGRNGHYSRMGGWPELVEEKENK